MHPDRRRATNWNYHHFTQVLGWCLGWVEHNSTKLARNQPEKLSLGVWKSKARCGCLIESCFQSQTKGNIHNWFYDRFRHPINWKTNKPLKTEHRRSFLCIIGSFPTLYWKWFNTVSKCSGIGHTERHLLYIYIKFLFIHEFEVICQKIALIAKFDIFIDSI